MEIKNLSYLLLSGLRNHALTDTAARNMSKLTVNSKEYYKENISETTQRLLQSTRTISTELLDNKKVTNLEFLLIRQIANDLVYCNNLWRCKLDFNSKGNRASLTGLLEKKIIFKTDCKNLFVVNPYYIRFGEFYEVLYSTMNIVDTDELNLSMASIVRPVRELQN